MFDGRSFIVSLPAIIKAHTSKDGKRIVEVEASNQEIDSEGDMILQKALLDSSESFIKSGHCDIDHISELGHRMGIPNPSAYIVGRPIEVKDYGKGCTGVVSEIRKAADGKCDPTRNKYDEFWESLNTDPPVKWSASIYGFPKSGMIDDCRRQACDSDATRYVVRGIDWRSLAFTTKPINSSLTRYAKVVTAKSFIELLKGGSPLMPVTTVGLAQDTAPPTLMSSPVFDYSQPSGGIGMAETGPAQAPFMYLPHNMDSLIGQHRRHMSRECQFTGGINSIIGFKSHFMSCCGAPEDTAEMLAHALMYHILLEKRRS